MAYKRPVTIITYAETNDVYGKTTQVATTVVNTQRMVENVTSLANPFRNTIVTSESSFIIKLEKDDVTALQAIIDAEDTRVSFDYNGVTYTVKVKEVRPYVRQVLGRIADVYCISSNVT